MRRARSSGDMWPKSSPIFCWLLLAAANNCAINGATGGVVSVLCMCLEYEVSFAFSIRIPEARLPRLLTPITAPRKQPKQQRSTHLVDAILKAAIRVLEREGAAAFTTVRVAEKAGVS